MKNFNLKNVISGIAFFFSAVFSVIGIVEFYNVSVIKNVNSYPFGIEGDVPYYYKTAELYSLVNLTYGIVFALLFVINIWNWKKHKINQTIMNVLIFTFIAIQMLHSIF